MQMPQNNSLDLFHRGIPLEEGVCPTLLYFAVGGKESLHTDPFCQPVDYFLNGKTRVLSVDLPFHGADYENNGAMNLWALSLAGGDDFIERFLNQVKEILEDLKEKKIIEAEKFAVAGLSRGGYLAILLAAYIPWIQHAVTFAPVTHLEKVEGFENLDKNPLLMKWSLLHFAETLAPKRLRFYIGNLDTLVDTDACYILLRTIVRKGKAAGVRIPLTEMIITPSAGFKGHGTLPHIFEDGVTWVRGFLEY